ncbi:MAG: hypothetical protein AB9836_01010 [Aminipila sp.]
MYDREGQILLQSTLRTNGKWQKTGVKKFGKINLESANSAAEMTQTILSAVIDCAPEAGAVLGVTGVVAEVGKIAYNKAMKGIWGLKNAILKLMKVLCKYT